MTHYLLWNVLQLQAAHSATGHARRTIEGGDKNSLPQLRPRMNEEFIRAIQVGLLEKAQGIFYNNDVDINTVNDHGRNSVHIASRNGNLRILQWLHQEGAAFNADGPQGDNAFHLACWNGHVKVMDFLYNRAFVDAKSKNDEGLSPAHVAARRGHIGALKWLACNGMNLFTQDHYGYTPADHVPREHKHIRSYLRGIQFGEISPSECPLPEIKTGRSKPTHEQVTKLLHNSQFGYLGPWVMA